MKTKRKKNKKKPEDFAHLHVHSDASQLDGCGRIGDYVSEAKRRGNKSIAFTEHGSMRGYLQLKKEAEASGVKPIYGIEFYVSPDMHRKGLTPEERKDVIGDLKAGERKNALAEYESREGIRDRWHTTCWAMNETGMRNLQKLSSAAFVDGFYYKPRVDLDALCENNEGLAVSTGCLSGPVNDCWVAGKRRFALDFADRLHESFGDRMYLEIQPHNLEEQVTVNKLALKLKDRFGKASLLATQDAHYVHQEDHEAHDALLCIGTGRRLSDADRFHFDGDEFHFRTRRQMRDAFLRHHPSLSKQRIKEALDSTVELAERCNVSVEIDYKKALLPDSGIPKKHNGDAFKYLKELCLEGWTWRGIPQRAREYSLKHGISTHNAHAFYAERLKSELRELKRQRIEPYFLVVHDLYQFARSEDIMCGPGRGSAGGSLVAYLLGITSIDPVQYGLLFERFINPDRSDLPDIDMDFEDARRREVIDYLVNKYGRDKVCQIATIGRLSGKSVLRDVSRVLSVPLQEVNEISPSIIERPDGHPRQYKTIEDSFSEFEVCRQFSDRHPDVLKLASKLEGLAKTLGIHAAGVVASPVPLAELIPLEIRKHKGTDIVVSAIDMNEIASVGLVKLDILGLKTLTVVKDSVSAIEDRHGVSINMEEIDMNDRKVLKRFTALDFTGVFQYDTPSAYKLCEGIEFEDFEDISVMTALNRPGATQSGQGEKYLARKKDPRKRGDVDFHPLVNEICKNTLGVIVYQEHAIKIFTEVAGFDPGKADTLRKAIGKKKAEELKAARPDFVKGCREKSGIGEKIANRIFSAIEAHGRYSFNLSHATAYAAIGYWCMWLKTYYPIEFYCALLKSELERGRIKAIAKHAKKVGVRLLDPHVNYSKGVFSIDPNGNVRGSLIDIKGVGAGAVEAIVEAQPFKSFLDFATRIDRRRCNRGAVVALIKAGTMRDMLPNQKYFEENLDGLWKILMRKRNRSDLIRGFWAEAKAAPCHTEEERMLVASRVNPLAFGENPLEAYQGFMDAHVKVPLTSMSDAAWSELDGKGIYVAGMLLDARAFQVGDFHTGDLPNEKERKRMFWGKRYANVNMEGSGGNDYRVNFDIDVYEHHREIIESGEGTPVIIHATVDKKYKRLRAHFAVDLEKLRSGVRNGESDHGFWERIVLGSHPGRRGKKDGLFRGVVTNVRRKYDSTNRQMAFFGLLGSRNKYVDVVCFASAWGDVKRIVKRGSLLSIELESKTDPRRGTSVFFNGGHIARKKLSAEWRGSR